MDVLGAEPVADHRPVRKVRVEEAVRLHDPDVARRAPQARRAVQGADDDRDGEQGQERREPPGGEDAEEAERLEEVRQRGAQRGLHAGAQDRQLLREVGRRAEGGAGQLRDDDPDHAHAGRSR